MQEIAIPAKVVIGRSVYFSLPPSMHFPRCAGKHFVPINFDNCVVAPRKWHRNTIRVIDSLRLSRGKGNVAISHARAPCVVIRGPDSVPTLSGLAILPETLTSIKLLMTAR